MGSITQTLVSHFNPRAPYGARPPPAGVRPHYYRFQSTRPIRGATIHSAEVGARHNKFQSTRPIRGATIASLSSSHKVINFNPRAPYGARPGRHELCDIPQEFQSTRPIRGATLGLGEVFAIRRISIHAPHTGRDCPLRSPYPVGTIFQSTRPIRGATLVCPASGSYHHISIHAPHTGRDACSLSHRSFRIGFQSTRPIRGATDFIQSTADTITISIHAPHTGRDLAANPMPCNTIYFNPRAPYGARQQKCIIYVLHFCNNRQLKHKKPTGNVVCQNVFLINSGTQLAKVGANLPDAFCSLLLRTRSSVCPLADTIACSRNARSSFHTASLNSKIADYPAGDP